MTFVLSSKTKCFEELIFFLNKSHFSHSQYFVFMEWRSHPYLIILTNELTILQESPHFLIECLHNIIFLFRRNFIYLQLTICWRTKLQIRSLINREYTKSCFFQDHNIINSDFASFKSIVTELIFYSKLEVKKVWYHY